MVNNYNFLTCSTCEARSSIHINCGGGKITIGKTTYEEDDSAGGAAKFTTASGWGFSSSGEYWNADDRSDYIARSPIQVGQDSGLYTEARISATSLTYFGLCLTKGNYRVTLLFSEIVFANNKSFSSLGRRKFDIYIQEKLVYKDFEIVRESNGKHRAVKKIFPSIPVNNSIEIRLYYAGKGSTAIPDRKSGAYGPLISAISVESESKPGHGRKGIWISIGAASLFLCSIIILLAVVRRKCRGENVTSREKDLLGFNLQTGVFSYRQIKAATNNFNDTNKIGEGGFGSVYLGTLLDGSHIAVKKLSSRSSQGNREFINEIGMISGLHHPNLAKMYGCCVEESQLFLIYEYMENNNLARALFDGCTLKLDWPARQRISIGVARGLTFLHEESIFKMVHRDIKAENILLDRNLNAKISDFGLARLHEEENSHISTRVAGTVGYMAPEYALWGYLTYKADVYSFGVVLLEIVAGRRIVKFQPDEKCNHLLDKAFVVQQTGDVTQLLDPTLGPEYNKEEALRMISVALLCTNPTPALRPTMSTALAMLEGTGVIQEPTWDPTMQSYEMLYRASKKQHELIAEKETQSLVFSSALGGESSSRS